MNRRKDVRSGFGWIWALWGGVASTVVLSNATQAAQPDDDLIVRTSRVTGLATFVTARDGGPISAEAATARAAAGPMSFLQQRGHLFGVTNPEKELSNVRTTADRFGQTHTTYQQVHRGVPVFSGIIKVHQNTTAAVVAANGDFYPIPDKVDTIPTLPGDEAVTAAREKLGSGEATVEHFELVIVDPGWYGDPPAGEHLAYYIILSDSVAGIREAFFVNAHDGAVLDQWSLVQTGRNRRVYDFGDGPYLPGQAVRIEGGPPVSSPMDANYAYDYAGDVYDYFSRAFGRDSINDGGMTMMLTVNYSDPICPNAFWNGQQMVFCDGTVTDDITAHEIGHGITQYTANLIYQNQPGQLNESYSDIWGELVDLFNGNAAFPGTPGGTPWPKDFHYETAGQDTPNNLRGTVCSLHPTYGDGVRWLMGEDADAFGGAIRDMWNPTCHGLPDRANSPHQVCPATDNGGVHIGMGVPCHAFAMVTDGKTFNEYTVNGIGPIKAAAVWYRALTVYLTVASDFRDAYFALNQAAQDLVGTYPPDPRTGLPSDLIFTEADAAEVDKALLAVEMNTDGSCGAVEEVLNSAPPNQCWPRSTVFADDFESGAPGWTVWHSGSLPTPYDWELTDTLPYPRSGTAYYCADPGIGNCGSIDESGNHRLKSPVITLPAEFDRPTLAFTHFVATEPGWDGGNVKISVNGGSWYLIPPSAFDHNPYNTALNSYTQGNTNPLAGQDAWTGAGGSWGTSLADLTTLVSGSDTIQILFDFGKDGCTGLDGWYVDDFEIYVCGCATNAHCDDGVFCNGAETCTEAECLPGTPPCVDTFCDKDLDACFPAVFWDDFESGNIHGWELGSPDNTASSGQWEIGDPYGTTSEGDQAQPEDAYEGTSCAFTGQNSSLSNGDVDQGIVYLVSPPIDLAGDDTARLSYVRWFFNLDVGEDPADFFTVEVSDDDGASWVTLETLDSNQNANTWTRRGFDLQDHISLTDAVKIRFGTSDGPGPATEFWNVIEGALDNVAVTSGIECITAEDCDDGDPCTDDTCVDFQCVHNPICIAVVSSTPPSGAIDARQPHAFDDSGAVYGWDSIEIEFLNLTGPPPGTFTVTEVGGDGIAPTVSDVAHDGTGHVTVTLSEPIEPGAWTVIDHDVTAWTGCLGYLPGDVDASGSNAAADVQELIDALNEVPGAERPDYATDSNRSGATNAQDILRLIDLLTGAGAFTNWISQELPPNPCD